jgi:hypothetical protein
MKRSLKDLINQAPEQNTALEISSLPRGFKSVEGDRVTVDMDFLRGMNIFFATPCYGGLVTDQYFLSIFKLTQVLIQYKIPFRITTLRNESLISRARNILTAMFLEDTSATHLMFIDADIEFEPDSVIRMLALDKDIIAGAYPKKTINWSQVESAVKADKPNISTYGAEYAINLKIDPETKKVRTTMGALEVLDASTGFMIVKRKVFEQLIDKHPELFYKNDSSIDAKYNKYCYALWDTSIDPTDRRYLSEDYTFCRRWQNIGGEIWVDPNTKLNHVGSYTYEGDLSNILKKA